jgi:hypothetical protein
MQLRAPQSTFLLIFRLLEYLSTLLPLWNILLWWNVESDEFEQKFWERGRTGRYRRDGISSRTTRPEPAPYSSGIEGSKHGHMRELRVQGGGRPIRIFYAFDPRRSAILLIGGDKTGRDRFYEETVPVADGLYDVHLEELKKEGLI